MDSPTIVKVRFYGYQATRGSDFADVDLPLNTKICDIPLYLAKNHGFCTSYGVKMHGQAEQIIANTYATPPDEVTVTAGPSHFSDDETPFAISQDEPLISFSNKVYHTSEDACTIRTNREEEEIDFISVDELKIVFRRTIRVPDDGKTHNLPPALGSFPIFNVAAFAKSLPLDTVEKGGVFIAMYQREAMWIQFYTYCPFVVKVYVGGINGVSGDPMVPNMATYLKQQNHVPRKQDYLVLPSQLWLDGIATAPGLVKQFVAVPYGSGYSVEHQVTGMETVGGLQFEVIPGYDTSISFFRQRLFDSMESELDIFATPKDLGLGPGETVYMMARTWMEKRPVVLWDLFWEKSYNPAHGLAIDLHQIFDGRLEISAPEKGKSISLQSNSSIPFKYIIKKITKRTGLPAQNRHLWIGRQEVSDWDDIKRLSPQLPGPETQTLVALRWAQEPSPTSSLPWVYIQGPTGKPLAICCKLSDTVGSVKEKITQKTVQLGYDKHFMFAGKEISDSKTLADCGIQFESMIDMQVSTPRLWGGCSMPERMMGIAAGGTIKQSIVEDKSDPREWNTDKARLINVQIVNSVWFEEITGMAMPPTPISMETYASTGLPFFDIYNETPSDVAGSFAAVRTVSEMDVAKGARADMVYDPTKQQICGMCSVRMRDCIVRPCDHCLCRVCAEKIVGSGKGSKGVCPACRKRIARIVGISAPMNAPGHEAVDKTLPVVMLKITDRRERFRSIVTRTE